MALDNCRRIADGGFNHLDYEAKQKNLMGQLEITALLTPILVLLINTGIYIYLGSRTANKQQLNAIILYLLLFSFLLNLAWEMLQMPFFKNMHWNWQSTIFCAFASLADTLMVLLLYNIFALVNKDVKWVLSITSSKFILLSAIGGIGAILAELRHLRAGSWSYTELMPIIPFVNVGLVPVLQFMFLPIIIFRLTARFIKQ